MSRFDYVAYDNKASETQNQAKELAMKMELLIEAIPLLADKDGYGKSARARAIALTKLEEVYMWIGKAVRDDQIARNGTVQLQEGRKDG